MNTTIALPRPLAALLILLTASILAVVAVAAAWANLDSLLQERDAKVASESRSRMAGRGDPSRTAEISGHTLSVVAESDTLAAARIDSLFRATVRDEGGTVLSSRAEVKRDEATANQPERISVQAVIEGRIEVVAMILLRLESGTPLVVVDATALRPVEAGDGDPLLAKTPLLNASLTLSTYWQARAVSAP